MSERSRRKGQTEERAPGGGGFLCGLTDLLEKLGDLAEKGGELHKSGEFGRGANDMKGVYGFNIKVGLGDDGVKVEPFGNVHRDEKTGEAVVSEVSEPLVDVFEEDDHVLVIAEMPGVAEEDVDLALKDDILTIAGARGQKKYRKEVLLPQTFTPEQMKHTCRNGILEVKFSKGSEKGRAK